MIFVNLPGAILHSPEQMRRIFQGNEGAYCILDGEPAGFEHSNYFSEIFRQCVFDIALEESVGGDLIAACILGFVGCPVEDFPSSTM